MAIVQQGQSSRSSPSPQGKYAPLLSFASLRLGENYSLVRKTTKFLRTTLFPKNQISAVQGSNRAFFKDC